jgi:hypothetical protein
VNGYTTAFVWAAALFAAGLLVAVVILPSDGATRAETAHAQGHADLALENA